MCKLFIFFVSLFILLGSCSNKKEIETSILSDEKIELQMVRLYKEGLKEFDNGFYLEAAKKFNDAELIFPQSEWAPKASLMAAYSFFYSDYNSDAIIQIESFLKTYPNHPNIDYAYYLLALSNYNMIIDEKKDLDPLIKSKSLFEFVLNNYSETEYAVDSRFKIDLINQMLASKEMYLAKYYIKKEKWIPAINRLKFIIDNYQTTVYIEEALHRLVEIYYKIGLIDESRKYAAILGHNFPNSDWYENSYKIYNKNFNTSKIEDKKSSLEKLKSILD